MTTLVRLTACAAVKGTQAVFFFNRTKSSPKATAASIRRICGFAIALHLSKNVLPKTKKNF